MHYGVFIITFALKLTDMNPFIITGKIPEKYFCDRRNEAGRIIRGVTQGDNLCLISERRMGKSKLISFCYDKPEISDSHYTFYVDILHTKSFREFTYQFGQTVFTQLIPQSRKMLMSLVQGLKSLNAKFGFNAMTGLPEFSLELGDITRPEYTVEEIFRWLENADKPCIVAFDEFQQIGKYPENNIEALLRSYIQNLGNVHFIFAGSERHMISQMFLSSARPFYNSASVIELPPISKNEYIPFVDGLFKEADKNILIDDILKIYDMFEGNTWCMQKTFHEAFAITQEHGTCTLETLRQTIDSILEESSTGYRLMLSGIPTRQKELLYAIAAEWKASKITGVDFIRKYSLASSSSVQTAAASLRKNDLIDTADGIWYVPDIMLRLYLQRMTNPGRIFLQ